MAFHAVLFPPAIAYGVTGGPRFMTTIIELMSGHEQRNIGWSHPRGEWDCAHGIKTQAELDAVRAFFYAREGRAHGFLFKDWADCKFNGARIDAGGHAYKRYTSGGVTYDRRVWPVDAEEFYLPVRFDTDFMAARLDYYNVLTWGQIIIKEIKLWDEPEP